MSTPGKGRAGYLALGDWNAICFECGRKFKSTMLKRHWQGYYVCPEHWEPRHPQDFVRGIPDVQTPPWTQTPPRPNFVVIGGPQPPTNLVAAPALNRITLTWNPVAGASSYNLYWSLTPTADLSGTEEFAVTSPTTLAELVDGVFYYAVVTAITNGLESGPSNEIYTSPQAGELTMVNNSGEVLIPINNPGRTLIIINNSGD